MRRFASVIAVSVLMCAVSPVVAQEAPGDDRDILATLVAGVRQREAAIPALTVCGVYRGFYTELKWEILDKVLAEVGATDDAKGQVRTDRAAVAMVLWESVDGDEWQEEFQGIYRGPNTWVYPQAPAEPHMVADMYRAQRGTPDRVVEVDYTSGYPTATVTPPPLRVMPRHAFGALSTYLGLSSDLGVVLSDRLAVGLDQPRWHLQRIGREGTVYRVRMIGFGGTNEEAFEQTFEIDSALSYAVLRHRYMTIVGGQRGFARELQWDDFREVGFGVPRLPWSATRWEFDYGHPDREPLVQTQRFTCLQLNATEPEVEPSWVPRCAFLDRPQSDSVLALVAAEQLEATQGSAIKLEVRDFAQEHPPDPPEDLMHLDPAKVAAEIKKQCGVE